jgi:hypothetical protein
MNFHSTNESCRFRSFAEADDYTEKALPKEEGASIGMSDEEWLARLYCKPKPFWHCTRQFDGSTYYTFDEINDPEEFLAVVEKYTGNKPSSALRQLHRRVESARAELRQKQDDACGKRKVGSQTPDRYLALEKAAWIKFNRQKQDYLPDYLKSVSGTKPVRRRLTHKCKQCGEPGVKKGFKFCALCAKERKRESNRRSKRRSKDEMAPRELCAFLGRLATPVAERPILMDFADSDFIPSSSPDGK